jgi:hypothetical protein
MLPITGAISASIGRIARTIIAGAIVVAGAVARAHNWAAGNHYRAYAHDRRTNESIIFDNHALGVRTAYASDTSRKKKCREKLVLMLSSRKSLLLALRKCHTKVRRFLD